MKNEKKKNSNGQGTLKKKPNGHWELRITAGRDANTGKLIRKTKTFKRKSEALEYLRQYQRDKEDGIQFAAKSLTVGEWLDTWLAEYVNDIKPATRISYAQHIKNHIAPALGSITLDKLSGVDIQKFYNSLLNEKHLSPKTIKNIHGVLHGALEQACKLNFIRSNLANVANLPRITKKEMKVLDKPQLKRFLDALDESEYSTIIRIDLFTGMREGEILGLRWKCIDFERGTVLIDKQLTRPRQKGDQYCLASLKNDKPRIIQPAPYVMNILKAHRQFYLAKRLAAGAAWNDSYFPDLVFTTPTGGHLNYQLVLRHVKQTLDKAGLPDMRFHDLRHTYAVISLQNGDDIKTVQTNLGHHSAAFTLDTYAHVTDSMREASARRMENFINDL